LRIKLVPPRTGCRAYLLPLPAAWRCCRDAWLNAHPRHRVLRCCIKHVLTAKHLYGGWQATFLLRATARFFHARVNAGTAISSHAADISAWLPPSAAWALYALRVSLRIPSILPGFYGLRTRRTRNVHPLLPVPWRSTLVAFHACRLRTLTTNEYHCFLPAATSLSLLRTALPSGKDGRNETRLPLPNTYTAPCKVLCSPLWGSGCLFCLARRRHVSFYMPALPGMGLFRLHSPSYTFPPCLLDILQVSGCRLHTGMPSHSFPSCALSFLAVCHLLEHLRFKTTWCLPPSGDDHAVLLVLYRRQ